jgi:hypothetical protein
MTKMIFILSATGKNTAIEKQGKGADHGGDEWDEIQEQQ